MTRLAAERVGVAFLLSLALLVNGAAQKFSPDDATVIFVTAARGFIPLLEEAIDDGEKNLPASGPSYLQPTIFRPALVIAAAKQSDTQTADSTKKNSKLYRQMGVLLI